VLATNLLLLYIYIYIYILYIYILVMYNDCGTQYVAGAYSLALYVGTTILS
jgi:hypothetical protein